MTIVKVIAAMAFLSAGFGALCQCVDTKLDEQKHSPIGRMVDVGGYKLHMIDSGKGSPTVVISPGLGDNSLDWTLVYPEISKFTRVIVSDRAGYAWSDASPLPRTSENIVQELHRLLKNGNVPGPYILVGHSFGGLSVLLFASAYPDEVAGVVLVDSSHEDQHEKFKLLDAPPSIFETIEDYLLVLRSYFQRYFGIERFIRERAAQKSNPNEKKGMLADDVQHCYLASRMSSKFMNAKRQEFLNWDLSCEQIKSNGGVVGDKPLTVITAGKKKVTEDHTQEHKQVWFDLQDDLVTKLPQGKQIFAEKSGHRINTGQPGIIIEAVRELVDELRIGQ